MKIVTWNVNSIRVRLPHVLDWLAANQPDILAIQETKAVDENFPQAEFTEMDYQAIFCGQKTYNGVAILSKKTARDIVEALPGFEDEQKRFQAATYGQTRVINIYVPNGAEVGSDKYDYKLKWLKQFVRYLKEELKTYPNILVVGDYNIAPADIDVHNPEAWEGSVLVSDKERRAFREVIKAGFVDTFRLFEQPEKSYSWWDYRALAFRRNRGLRIDHILCSDAMQKKCQACYIDKEPRKLERPSDHTPVVAEFK